MFLKWYYVFSKLETLMDKENIQYKQKSKLKNIKKFLKGTNNRTSIKSMNKNICIYYSVQL